MRRNILSATLLALPVMDALPLFYIAGDIGEEEVGREATQSPTPKD